jgi:hypothetical protein
MDAGIFWGFCVELIETRLRELASVLGRRSPTIGESRYYEAALSSYPLQVVAEVFDLWAARHPTFPKPCDLKLLADYQLEVLNQQIAHERAMEAIERAGK